MLEVESPSPIQSLMPPLPLEHIYQTDLSAGAERAAYEVYSRLLSDLEASSICRIWNFIPDIHSSDHGDERYRQLCVGRHRAFCDRGVENFQFPAATAIGSFDANMVVGALSANGKIIHLSNDMQVNAYDYPRQYGRVGPSFSRASLTDKCLYISGTASITGHQTQHAEDIESQTRLTLRNIWHLLDKASQVSGKDFCFASSDWRIYLRNMRDKARVLPLLESALGSANKEYCHAEVCREDLLVEIEGVCHG